MLQHASSRLAQPVCTTTRRGESSLLASPFSSPLRGSRGEISSAIVDRVGHHFPGHNMREGKYPRTLFWRTCHEIHQKRRRTRQPDGRQRAARATSSSSALLEGNTLAALPIHHAKKRAPSVMDKAHLVVHDRTEPRSQLAGCIHSKSPMTNEADQVLLAQVSIGRGVVGW